MLDYGKLSSQAFAPYTKKKQKEMTSMQRVLKLAEEMEKGDKEAITKYMSDPTNMDIAPVRKTNKEEAPWYTQILKGSEAFNDNLRRFDDGYNIGDLTTTGLETIWDTGVTAVSTVGDVASNLAKGILTIPQETSRSIANVIAQGADWAGNDEWAREIRTKTGTLNPFTDPIQKAQDKYLDPNSISGKYADMVGEGIGYSGALAGVGLVAPQLVIPTIFSTAAGNATKEVYSKGPDVSNTQAWTKILGSATIETLTESLFQLMGVGGTKWTKDLTNKAIGAMTTGAGKVLMGTGIAATGEAAEEFISYMGNYLLDNGLVDKIGDTDFSKDWDWGEVGEQMAVAFASSGILQGGMTKAQVNSAIKSEEQALGENLTNKQKADLTQAVLWEGNTDNEQKVVDEVTKNRIAEAEKDGTKLDNKKKKQIAKEVQEDLEKGLIDVNDIESVLGGDTYTQLQSVTENAAKIEEQIKELESKPNAEITVAEKEKLDSLREQLPSIDTNTLRTNLNAEMGQKIAYDGYLQQSYQEKAKRSSEFTYEVSDKDSDFKKGVYESTKGKLNDTTRSHDMADALVKLSEDRKMQYKFTNNAELKDMGIVQEGKTANGLYVVDNNGTREILVNTNSKKYVESVLIHETAHDFKNTSPELYTNLTDVTKEFAEAKGDYARVYSEVAGNYKNVEGVNIEEEVTSRLLEDYLGNKDFISELSTKQPNIVQKIIEEIKYLYKKFTSSSPEARKLLELQHQLEQTYKEAYRQTEATEAKAGVKYSLSDNNEIIDDNGNTVKLEASNAGTHGTLMAIHNISREKLNGILELGGFPVPSIAVMNPKTTELGYGDISVLFDKSTIDPAIKENEAYASDVYSKRFPQTTQKINEKELSTLNKYLGKDLYLGDTTLEEAVQKNKYNKELINKFAEENNIKVEDVYRDNGYNYAFSTDEATREFITENDITYDKLLNDVDLRNKFYDLYRQSSPDIVSFTERKIETFEKIFNEQGNSNNNTKERLNSDFNAIKNGSEKIKDDYATEQSLREKVLNEYENDYTKFIRDKLSPVFEEKYIRNDTDLYTPSGNRRSFNQLYNEYNLDNIVKAMKGKTRGEEGFFYGAGNIRSQVTPQFKSIADIKASENKLVTNSQMEAVKEDIDSNLSDLTEAARNYGGYDYDSYGYALNEIGQLKKITNAKAKKILEDYGFKDIPDILVDNSIRFLEKLKNAPTEYFESKPQRAVGLDEVKGVVIPNNVDVEFKQQLQEYGLEYYEYNPSIEGDRQRVINQFDDLKFSLSNETDTAPASTRNKTATQDIKLQEVSSEVDTAINDLFTRLNNVAKGIEVDEKEFAPVTDPDELNESYREAFNSITDEDIVPTNEVIAPIEDTLPNGITLNSKDVTKEIMDLGVGKKYNTKEINAIIKELNKMVDKGTDYDSIKIFADELGDRLLVEDTVWDDSIQDYAKWIRDAKLYVGKNAGIKNDIADYNDFRKKYFGRLKLTNKREGSLPVDTLYQELNSERPDLFPDDITHTSDQLQHMAEILDQAKSNNITIKEYLGKYEGRDAWDWTANHFSENIINKIIELDNARQEKLYNDFYSNVPLGDAPYASNTDNIAPINEQYEAIEPRPTKSTGPKMIRIKNDAETKQEANEKIAKVLDIEPETDSQRNQRKLAIIAANVLDKGLVFENVSLKNKNRELMGKWDYTLTSEARAQNVIGKGHYEYDPVSKTSEQISKSLNDIRTEVDNTGLTKQFYEYMYHKHNVDRMNLEGRYEGVENKPVFGYDVDSAASQEIVNQYEFSNPEFMDYARDVYNYLEADRQQLVKEGVISQETADLWAEMYPHYVPIRRVDSKGLNINVPLDTGRTGVNAPIKKAVGGNTDILPLFDTMAQRTLQTYRATAKNSFGVELMDTLGTKIDSQQANIDEVIDSVDNQEGLLQENNGKPTFTVFENGEKTTFSITPDMYDALKPLSDSSLLSKTFTPLNVVSSIHRGVLTQYNPIFALTNGIKDAQDILINSQHAVKTYSKIPEAWAQYLTKGYWYEEYIANGGEQNSYFDSQDNTFKAENTGIRKILDLPPLKQIAQLNDFIEIGPRLAEYIASREAGRSTEVSMLDAARVTTNFKAGGNLTKFLNRNGATFLNASMQGAMQQVRNIREAKANGVRGWLTLATKFAVAGLPAMLLNAMLWEDDDEYEELSDYVKQNYYIVGKDDNGNFIRVPKGRTLAVIQNGVEQMQNLITGDDEADLGTFINLALTNLAPNNPIESNIFSPIAQIATNKTWYGGDLVPSRLQDLPAAEQYDESTDNFSKWIGEIFNVSPMQVNYALNQYTGGVGDVILPMMTPEATSDSDTFGEQIIAPLKSKFTTNATMNNQNVSDFYDTKDKLTTEAKKAAATDEDVLKNKYINSINADMNDLYKEKREIQNSNLSKSEKYRQVKEVQSRINELSKKALENYEDVDIRDSYSSAGGKEYYKDTKGEWKSIDDKEVKSLNYLGMGADEKNRYFNARNSITDIVKEYKGDKENLDTDDEEYDGEVSLLSGDKKVSIINAIKKSNLNDEQMAYLYDKYYASPEKLNTVVKTGIGMNAYLDLEAQGFTADVNSEGKTISGSKKNKVFNYINSTDLGFEQRVILAKMYYPSYDEYNYDIINYLNNDSSISFEDMSDILKSIGFKVDKQGNVTWD